jgi:recombinational DNA repair protein (RecF pathway)
LVEDAILMREYERAILQLSAQENMESTLRVFEAVLLQRLGYGIDFFHDAKGSVLDPDGYYHFVPEQGLVCVGKTVAINVGRGEDFLAIGNQDFASEAVRKLAKVTMRSAIAVCLGGKKLRSRELFF